MHVIYISNMSYVAKKTPKFKTKKTNKTKTVMKQTNMKTKEFRLN